MKITPVSVSMVAVALLAGGIALLPAGAQPSGQPSSDRPNAQPPVPGRANPPTNRGERRGSEGREKFRDEIREHPRLGQALAALHDAKDYLEKAPNDFGGHKKAAIDSIDASMKELKEALKFDPKRESGPEGDNPGNPNRPNRRPGGDRPGDNKPGDNKPADPPKPADAPKP